MYGLNYHRNSKGDTQMKTDNKLIRKRISRGTGQHSLGIPVNISEELLESAEFYTCQLKDDKIVFSPVRVTR